MLEVHHCSHCPAVNGLFPAQTPNWFDWIHLQGLCELGADCVYWVILFVTTELHVCLQLHCELVLVLVLWKLTLRIVVAQCMICGYHAMYVRLCSLKLNISSWLELTLSVWNTTYILSLVNFVWGHISYTVLFHRLFLVSCLVRCQSSCNEFSANIQSYAACDSKVWVFSAHRVACLYVEQIWIEQLCCWLVVWCIQPLMSLFCTHSIWKHCNCIQ